MNAEQPVIIALRAKTATGTLEMLWAHAYPDGTYGLRSVPFGITNLAPCDLVSVVATPAGLEYVGVVERGGMVVFVASIREGADGDAMLTVLYGKMHAWVERLGKLIACAVKEHMADQLEAYLQAGEDEGRWKFARMTD